MKNIHDWFEKIYPAQQAASKERYERLDALACFIGDGIRAAITAFNAEEKRLGVAPAQQCPTKSKKRWPWPLPRTLSSRPTMLASPSSSSISA